MSIRCVCLLVCRVCLGGKAGWWALQMDNLERINIAQVGRSKLDIFDVPELICWVEKDL